MKYIQNYNTFLLNEGRSEQISIDKFSEIYNKNCKEHSDKKNDPIYRGVNVSFESNFYLVEPRKHKPRYSSGVLNVYSFLFDNILPSWKKFKLPKRAYSLICTSSQYRAKCYGRAQQVIPFDNSFIACLPVSDIWDILNTKFSHNNIDMNTIQLPQFNNLIVNIIDYFLNQNFNNEDFSGKSLKKQLLILDKKINLENFLYFYNNVYDFAKSSLEYDLLANYIKEGIKNNEIFIEILDKLFNPKSLNIQMRSYKKGFKFNNIKDAHRGIECWTEGPALLITENYYDKSKIYFND